jgi:hypothetical protein
MTDDRSERLRKRRKNAGNRTGDGDRDDAETRSVQADDHTTNGEGGDQDTAPIKEQQVGTYMYLPESQVKELRRLYNILKAEFEFEYDEEFEKNRHFYPLVVQHGLEDLDGLDASEIRECLDTYYE